jgi:hypothetical protein
MVEVMKLDIHASEHDILIATLKQLQEQEVKTTAEKVDRLMHQYRARGLAVVGLHETLEALANGQVEELFISGTLDGNHPLPEEVEAIFAPEIPDSEGETESDEPRQASLPDPLVTKAKQTGATVTFIEDATLLESTGVLARSCDGACRLLVAGGMKSSDSWLPSKSGRHNRLTLIPPSGTRQMVANATRASENIPTRRHPAKTTLEEL